MPRTGAANAGLTYVGTDEFIVIAPELKLGEDGGVGIEGNDISDG